MRHSLKGVNLIPVIKGIRGGQPEALNEYARMGKDKKTDNLELADIEV
jgi:hypothetical protein